MGDPPGDGNLELANAPPSPCHRHIDAAYDCSMYYQLSNLFCLCPAQQATICDASLTRIYKTTADHRKYHSPLDGHHYKDSEASKRVRPNAPHHPSSVGSRQKDLSAPIPKNWASHLLRGEC